MIIELNNVSIANTAYLGVKASGYKILTNVNLKIDNGELVYLIGKVGSGKSTLIKALYGEIPITKGEAYIVGYNLRTITSKQIPYMRRRMGIMLQDYQLLPDRNIYENMKYVLMATSNMTITQIHNRVYEVLEIVQLENKARKMPYELSSGEQQRATIARAFLNSPQLIIADEPTANLDPATSSEIMDIFTDLSKMGCSILLSTHDVSLIEQHPSRTLRCEGGVIEEINIYDIFGIKAMNNDTYLDLEHGELDENNDYLPEPEEYIEDEEYYNSDNY